MKQHSLVLTAKKKLEWTTHTLPALKKDEVLIKTIAGAISIGAELPQYDERDVTERSPSYPKETGYESYGEVIGVGDEVEQFTIGDRVVAFYGHKDYGIVNENKAIFVPNDIHHADALLVILSCDSAKGVLKLNPKEDDRVLVTGAGTMGLLTIYFLKEYMNVKYIEVSEPNTFRGGLAMDLGAETVYKHVGECPIDIYDYGFECSGFNGAFNTLQESLKYEGEICILSDGNKESFQLQPGFFRKELKVIGSSDGWDYDRHSKWYFDQIKGKDSGLKRLFEEVITSQDLVECFDDLSKGRLHPVKVLVEY
ncbi:alcohol dehydrogenase [Bacillus sp. BHET2]|uniref:alcohol dehydrogenase catalytic domain-containing protein n=1 Tax=Bacillus sp. BHET2 TaxID=2583818 RepID=UPI00110E6C44|nr:zinc-binding alcohol dehydrogenase [Bacillus sp. BHET2]TMU88165.1 alcohol dehydrogenase [Bacillus sp. BHET2]